MYRRILVPVDGSETGEKALQHAAHLAAACSAEVRLLHITDALAYCSGLEPAEVYIRDVLPAMREAGRHILAQARATLLNAGRPCDVRQEESRGRRVAELIVAHAKQWPADLIVMGTHGRRGFNRLLMGSDAELVARAAPVPVLLVGPGNAGAACAPDGAGAAGG